MIQFTRIKAYDCFAYRTLDFSFETGLHSVTGLNGSAKTSLFLTLIQGLFNRNPKGCKVDDVNNNVSGLPYEIEIEFRKGSDVYVVVNSRKKGTITISRNGTSIGLKRIPDALTQIQEILGCDYQLFCDLTYQSKNSTLNIMDSTTNKGRAEFVNRVLKLDELDAHLSRLNERRKQLEGKGGSIASLRNSIEIMTSSLGEVPEVEEEIPYDDSVLARKKEDVAKAEKVLEGIKAELAKAKAQSDVQQIERGILDRIRKLGESKVSDLTREELEELQKQDTKQLSEYMEQHTRLSMTLQQAAKVQEQLQKLQQLQQQRKEMAEPDKAHEECVDQLNKIVKAKASKSAVLKQAEQEYHRLQNASKIGTCPTCGTCVSPDSFTEQLTELNEQITSLNEFLVKCDGGEIKYKQRILEWKKIEQLEAQIDKLQEVAPVDVDVAVIKTSITLLDVKIQETKATLKTYADDLKTLQSIQIERARMTGADTSSDYTHLIAELVQMCNATLLKWDTLNKEVEAEEANRLWHVEHNTMVRTKAALVKQVEENNHKLQLSIDQKSKELAAEEETLDLLKVWIKVLGPTGYRTYQTQCFITALNATMHRYAQLMCEGKIRCRFYLDETGEIKFEITDSAKTQDITLWSGGETARIKTVCLFAVLELLEVMGSTSFNVLCLDEVFDALDHEGKEGLFRVLAYLKGRNKAIYTIAHSELALDKVYDSVITAVKHDDGTTSIQ